MQAQIKSFSQAQRNANDGISMIQTAEGGMSQTQDMLIRMKELATQGAISTLSDSAGLKLFSPKERSDPLARSGARGLRGFGKTCTNTPCTICKYGVLC